MPDALWGNNMRNKSMWAYVCMPVYTNRHSYAHTRLILKKTHAHTHIYPILLLSVKNFKLETF